MQESEIRDVPIPPPHPYPPLRRRIHRGSGLCLTRGGGPYGGRDRASVRQQGRGEPQLLGLEYSILTRPSFDPIQTTASWNFRPRPPRRTGNPSSANRYLSRGVSGRPTADHDGGFKRCTRWSTHKAPGAC
ncbi:hypothetical protein GCM10018952_44930 [Streptosporangium vulgare]